MESSNVIVDGVSTVPVLPPFPLFPLSVDIMIGYVPVACVFPVVGLGRRIGLVVLVCVDGMVCVDGLVCVVVLVSVDGLVCMDGLVCVEGLVCMGGLAFMVISDSSVVAIVFTERQIIVSFLGSPWIFLTIHFCSTPSIYIIQPLNLVSDCSCC